MGAADRALRSGYQAQHQTRSTSCPGRSFEKKPSAAHTSLPGGVEKLARERSFARGEINRDEFVKICLATEHLCGRINCTIGVIAPPINLPWLAPKSQAANTKNAKIKSGIRICDSPMSRIHAGRIPAPFEAHFQTLGT